MFSSTADRTGRQGFLLMEAVIGLAIIGLAAVAVLASTGTQVRTADKAHVLLVAEHLALDRMTSFEILRYDELQSPPDSLMGGVFQYPFDEYAWRASVIPVGEEYDLFQVDVVVEGRGEVLPLETYLHRARPVLAVVE